MSNRRAAATVAVIPSARRLITSLRDVGYDFVHAVADLVDNSIAAGATRVAVTLRFSGTESWVRIVDNGTGMSGSAITEAMRYGSNRRYAQFDLGKFGLGLKTASMSQCRRLTVASRTDRDSRRIEVRVLDLDHVDDSDRWEVLDIPSDERPEPLIAPLEECTGTVILWERLDRVLDYKLPWGEFAKKGILRLAEQLDLHLGMVFHRFLTGEAQRRKKLAITVNGQEVEPWDPFARSEEFTTALPEQEFEVRASEGIGVVRYQGFVLPAKERFSSPQAFERLGGPDRWNRQQGFYVYRADRMIQSGGWCRIRTADEHTKLARASLDFQPDLDAAFEINVAKIRVSLPPDLRDKLEKHVEALTKRARTAYDRKTRPTSASPERGGRSISSHVAEGDGARAGSSEAHSGTPGPNGSPHVSPTRIREVLEDAAKSTGNADALKRLMARVRKDEPEVARALGW